MKLRVWWIRNPPSNALYFDVVDVDAARKKIDELTQADLKDSSVTDNAGGLEAYESDNGGWSEYYDDEGRDISEIMREE